MIYGTLLLSLRFVYVQNETNDSIADSIDCTNRQFVAAEDCFCWPKRIKSKRFSCFVACLRWEETGRNVYVSTKSIFHHFSMIFINLNHKHIRTIFARQAARNLENVFIACFVVFFGWKHFVDWFRAANRIVWLQWKRQRNVKFGVNATLPNIDRIQLDLTLV